MYKRQAKEEFELPEYQELLKELGVDGEWEGIGHCAVGYVDGEIPKACLLYTSRCV